MCSASALGFGEFDSERALCGEVEAADTAVPCGDGSDLMPVPLFPPPPLPESKRLRPPPEEGESNGEAGESGEGERGPNVGDNVSDSVNEVERFRVPAAGLLPS